MKKTDKYILFIYTLYEKNEDIENLCIYIMSFENIQSVKFVVENNQNVIVIFDTTLDTEELSILFNEKLNENKYRIYLKFYYMFNFVSLVSAQISSDMKNFIFNENEEINLLKLNYKLNENKPNFNYDSIMERVKTEGSDILTQEERDFLNEFLLD